MNNGPWALVGVPGVFLRDKDYGGDSGPYDSHQIRPRNVQIKKKKKMFPKGCERDARAFEFPCS